MPLDVTYAHTQSRDHAEAVRDIAAQLSDVSNLDTLLFFCDADYDLDALGPLIKQMFPCPVVGCTSSGQIGPDGFENCGILAAGMRGGVLHAHPILIAPLSDLQAQTALAAETVQEESGTCGGGSCFGLLLVDGLSAKEELLAAALYQMIGNIPLIGGSAGDNLKFERTYVYHDGRFLSDAAVLALFESSVPFVTFKLQHFVPSDVELVITSADPETRIIREIDGEPAAQAYAEAIGASLEDLGPSLFSTHPLLLTIAGEPYVRSIQKVNDDLSLTCYCAIDEGLVVSVGQAVDVMHTLKDAFADAGRAVPEPSLIIGCDCILRRIEFEQTARASSVGQFMAEQKVFGFSTYGEQFNGQHVNQTFTGVAIGG
jgi:hypothetical protein